MTPSALLRPDPGFTKGYELTAIQAQSQGVHRAQCVLAKNPKLLLNSWLNMIKRKEHTWVGVRCQPADAERDWHGLAVQLAHAAALHSSSDAVPDGYSGS
jgi:hypothetical protein